MRDFSYFAITTFKFSSHKRRILMNKTPTNNKFVLDWIEEMAAMTCPDRIVWIDGSDEQADRKSTRLNSSH